MLSSIWNSIFTSATAFDVIQEQKLDINCFVQDEKSYLMDKSKTEFFSGLNAGEKYQKIRDGSIEMHFSETFDQVNALKKEDSESNFSQDCQCKRDSKNCMMVLLKDIIQNCMI